MDAVGFGSPKNLSSRPAGEARVSRDLLGYLRREGPGSAAAARLCPGWQGCGGQGKV